LSAFIAWAIFLASAGVVFVASQGLARAGDALAERTGISRTFIGVLLLATATSLPEIATGAAALRVVGSVDLAAGGLFGSNVFNLAIIALMELFAPGAALLSTVHRSLLMPTLASGLLIALALIFVLLPRTGVPSTGWVFLLFSFALLACYLLALYWMARHEDLTPLEEGAQAETGNPGLLTVRQALLMYAAATAVVVAGGVGLAEGGERISDIMGWSTSFVGTLFLAASTSLPEVSTSLAALRLGARDLAVANMVGSNLFNTGVIVFVLDLIYTKGPFLADLSEINLSTLSISLVMTAVVAIGVVARPRRKLLGPVAPETIALVGLFLLSHYMTY